MAKLVSTALHSKIWVISDISGHCVLRHKISSTLAHSGFPRFGRDMFGRALLREAYVWHIPIGGIKDNGRQPSEATSQGILTRPWHLILKRRGDPQRLSVLSGRHSARSEFTYENGQGNCLGH